MLTLEYKGIHLVSLSHNWFKNNSIAYSTAMAVVEYRQDFVLKTYILTPCPHRLPQKCLLLIFWKKVYMLQWDMSSGMKKHKSNFSINHIVHVNDYFKRTFFP